MATIEIHFRGPMLYVFQKGTHEVKEIVLPLVRTKGGMPSEPEGGSAGKHADDEKARDHWTGIFFPKNGSWHHSGPISGTLTITELSGGAAKPCVADSTFLAGALYLNAVTNDPAKPADDLERRVDPADERIAATIPLTGGTLSGVPSKHLFHIPKKCAPSGTGVSDRPLTLDAYWRPAKAGRVRMECRLDGGGTWVEEFGDGDQVYVYTADFEKPTHGQLTAEGESMKPGDVDVDFKWIYQMLKPKSGSLADWVKRAPCKKLPAPVYSGVKVGGFVTIKAMPNVSTCYSAVWAE